MATNTGTDEAWGEGVTPEADAVRALETAISALRNRLDRTARLAERLEQVCDAARDRSDWGAKLTEQAMLKLETDRSDAKALRIQLEAEVARMREALTRAGQRRGARGGIGSGAGG